MGFSENFYSYISVEGGVSYSLINGKERNLVGYELGRRLGKGMDQD